MLGERSGSVELLISERGPSEFETGFGTLGRTSDLPSDITAG